jgi:hypothetical protein
MLHENSERQYNVYYYHEVFADILAKITNLLMQKERELAKELIVFSIIYASAYNYEEKVYSKKELMSKDIDELLVIMVKEQKKAGLIPVQQMQRRSFLERMLKYYEQNKKLNGNGGKNENGDGGKINANGSAGENL